MAVPPAAVDDPSFPKTPEELQQIHTFPLDAYAAHESDWDARFAEIMN
jgi:hypothetical protein